MADSENAHMLVAVTYIRPVLIYWAQTHVCLMNSLILVDRAMAASLELVPSSCMKQKNSERG